MIRVGDTVRCIDASSRPEWAEWYQDDRYSEDMLERGKSYLVRAVAERDGQIGYDVGIPTPWGDPYWNADRFERALLRIAVTASAIPTEVETPVPPPTPPHHSLGE